MSHEMDTNVRDKREGSYLKILWLKQDKAKAVQLLSVNV